MTEFVSPFSCPFDLGNDDLRQDALMQQIFSLMNQLLSKDSNAKERHLRVRTYSIIPMTSASGILEFCQGKKILGFVGQLGAIQQSLPKFIQYYTYACTFNYWSVQGRKAEKSMCEL